MLYVICDYKRKTLPLANEKQGYKHKLYEKKLPLLLVVLPI